MKLNLFFAAAVVAAPVMAASTTSVVKYAASFRVLIYLC